MIGLIKQEKNIKIISLVLIISLYSSCNYWARNIQDLEMEKKNFSELPQAVRNIFINPSEFKKVSNQGIVHGYLDLICPKEKNRYELSRKHFFTKSWIAYYVIKDIQQNLEYKIEYGVPFPFIIYSDTLYIQDRYNAMGSNIDYKLLEFTCYALKDK